MAKNNKNKSAENNKAAEVAEEAVTETTETTAVSVEEKAEKTAENTEKENKTRKNPFKNKRFRHGALSVVFTIMFVVAIVLVNVVFNLVAARFDVSVDLTSNNVYSVEDSTLERLAKIDSKVTITITSPEDKYTGYGSYCIQTNEIAKKIAAANPNITLNYVDLLSNPNFMSQFDTELTGTELIVKSEATDRYRVIKPDDYLVYYNEGEQIDSTTAYYYSQYYGITPETRSAAEECLLSAIVGTTNVNPKTIAFATGYGETECAKLVSLAEKNAYLTETVNIDLVDEISADIDFLVIIAPTSDYSSEAITKIDKWLDNGGKYGKNLIYSASVAQETTTNIDEFLAEWGISVTQGVIYQTDKNYGYSSYGGGAYSQLLQLSDTGYAENMEADSKSTYFGNYVRPVKLLWEEYSNFINTPLLTTYGETSVVIPFDATDDWTLSDATDTGNFNAAVEASKVQYEDGTNPVYSKILVLGSELMLHENYLSNSNYTNAEFALSLFNSNNDQETISIAPKAFTMPTFEVVPAKTDPIAIVFAIVLPLVIIAVGIVVYVRRRRK